MSTAVFEAVRYTIRHCPLCVCANTWFMMMMMKMMMILPGRDRSSRTSGSSRPTWRRWSTDRRSPAWSQRSAWWSRNDRRYWYEGSSRTQGTSSE